MLHPLANNAGHEGFKCPLPKGRSPAAGQKRKGLSFKFIYSCKGSES